MDMSERGSELDQQREKRCSDTDSLLYQKPAHARNITLPDWANCRRQPKSYSVTILIVESIVRVDECLRPEELRLPHCRSRNSKTRIFGWVLNGIGNRSGRPWQRPRSQPRNKAVAAEIRARRRSSVFQRGRPTCPNPARDIEGKTCEIPQMPWSTANHVGNLVPQ